MCIALSVDNVPIHKVGSYFFAILRILVTLIGGTVRQVQQPYFSSGPSLSLVFPVRYSASLISSPGTEAYGDMSRRIPPVLPFRNRHAKVSNRVRCSAPKIKHLSLRFRGM